MPFESRAQAGELLASRLTAHAGKNPLILAIPRGGVPVGRAVAEALDGELDVILVHRLRSPGNPELSIGSIAEDGHVFLNAQPRALGFSDPYIKEESALQLEGLRRRRALFTPGFPPRDPDGRVTIVVNDGLVTGLAMIATLRALRSRGAARVILAVPVAADGTLEWLGALAHEKICLETYEDVGELGDHYGMFPPLTDEEAAEILRGRSQGSARSQRPQGVP